MSLRRRIADSPRVNQALEGALAAYIRFAISTSRWEREGFEAMDQELGRGEPIIVTLWHQRLALGPLLFNQELGRLCTLTSNARAGRLVGQLLGHFGFDTIPMSSHKRNVALSRDVLRRMKDGYSIGIAVDGPRGPAREASTVPLLWARSSGKRVFVVAWSANRVITFPSWDRFMMPMPYSRGVLLCRAWNETLPERPDAAETEEYRLRLQQSLDRITDEADLAAGRIDLD